MLVKDKKHFFMGLGLAIGFTVVFIFMFTPNFGNGLNAFEASDKMFNSISKGSTYYIDGLMDQAKAFGGTPIKVTVFEGNPEQAGKAAILLTANNVKGAVGGSGLVVEDTLGNLLNAALTDANAMFNNNGAALTSKYNMSEMQAMYLWWQLLMDADMALKAQKRFKEAKFTATVVTKGVEVGYNYYGVEPESAGSKIGMLVFSLVFYVVYTMWWGYAIFFLFEGLGLVMKAGAKQEV